MTIKEMVDKRLNCLAVMKGLLDKSSLEDRALTQEENTEYDSAEKEFDSLTVAIEKENRAQADRASREERLKVHALTLSKFTTAPALEHRGDSYELPERYHGRYARALEMFYEKTGGRRSTKEYIKAFRGYLADGRSALSVRALQADQDVKGGYLVAPELFVVDLIKEKDNMVFVRQAATVFMLDKAESLGAPALDADPADPTWTTELGTGSEDSTMGFEKRALTPHPLAKRIKVSKTLIRRSLIPVEDLVRERLAYKFAVVEENAYLNGTGANQPLGVMTASDMGISTGRDISTGNTTTAITADGLINAMYNVKAQYKNSPSLMWIFHRDAIKMIRKLKDGNGQYLWQAGLASDRPDTILNAPLKESEYMPSTFTTGLYVGILGDFKYYWIAESLGMDIQVLDQLYAETNQNGYIARTEIDGMPVLETAFTRVKLA